MLGGGLERDGELQQRCLVFARGRKHVGHGGLAAREGAGLVEHEDAEFLGGLQGLGIADQDARLRRAPDAHHQRRRRGKAERAGARDHQHGHRRHQRALQGAGHKPPGGKRDRGQPDHHRDEHGRDLVDELLHRGLGALRRRHEADDAGEQRVAAGAGGDAFQQAHAVDGSGKHAAAGRLVDGHALAGEHGFVDGRIALHHPAVECNGVAGTNNESIAGLERGNRHFHQPSLLLHPCGLGLQAHERFQRAGGARFGSRLEELSKEHQRDHGGRGLEVQVLGQAEGQHRNRETVGRAGA